MRRHELERCGFLRRRSIYNRYVDPTAGRQSQAEPNREMMPPPPPPQPAPVPTPAPVLQNNQNSNTDAPTNKLEESGGAKHIDAKLIAMITSEVNFYFSVLQVDQTLRGNHGYRSWN